MATRRKAKPYWERGYNGHVYWRGKVKLGKVSLRGGPDAPHKYTWEAGGRSGVADALPRAKQAVEMAVAVSARQLDLFS